MVVAYVGQLTKYGMYWVNFVSKHAHTHAFQDHETQKTYRVGKHLYQNLNDNCV